MKEIGSLIIATLCAAGCAGSAPASAPEKATPGEVWLTPEQVKDAHIDMETVAERPVGGLVNAAGRVVFDDLRVTHVFSPVTGKITKISAHPGDAVKKGQLLCVVQSPDLGGAIADMAKAKAVLFQTTKDWRRQRELYEVNAASQSVYEVAEAAYRSARAEMERAQRKARLLRGANHITQEYHLKSPIDGEVIMRGANPGLEIQGAYAGSTPELFTIGKLDRVWVLADVFEMDLPRIKKGAPVTFKVLAYPDERFPGHIEWISGALDPVSRTAKARFTLDNPKRHLRPEMFGTASIMVNPDTKLAIKRSALLLMGEQPVVFAVVGKTPDGKLRFVRRVVAVEEMAGGDYVPVIRGVKKGEQVVIAGGVLLLGKL
jgi:cobalt-zinc-cadmium efflux system membrane fusion protein